MCPTHAIQPCSKVNAATAKAQEEQEKRVAVEHQLQEERAAFEAREATWHARAEEWMEERKMLEEEMSARDDVRSVVQEGWEREQARRAAEWGALEEKVRGLVDEDSTLSYYRTVTLSLSLSPRYDVCLRHFS